MSVQQVSSSENDTVSANVAGFGVSYAIACVFNAILVVLKESSPGIHDAMVALTGHHWVTHGLLDLIVFLGLGYILSRRDMEMSGDALVKTVVGATILGGLIIVGYFI